MTEQPLNRSFLVIDVEKSSDRANSAQTVLRADLYAMVDEALGTAGLAVNQYAVEDRGDGVMVVADTGVLDVLDPVAEVVVEALARRNATVAPPDWMRLRIAVHHGLVHRDAHGWTGDALTTTFRINNMKPVKDVLRSADRAQSVLVVSDAVYRDVVCQGYRGLQPGTYREVADDERTAWVRVPGYAAPPGVATGPAAAEPVARGQAITINGSQIGSVHTAERVDRVDARSYFGQSEVRR
ncbi:hypothetical protein [Lentzea sp. NPDC004782]|uniref:hypothetical protein n=1 Tax=Lentzea sp. NPDC004782 TaxID=3154458 RepID=UPI0033A94F8C